MVGIYTTFKVDTANIKSSGLQPYDHNLRFVTADL